MLGTELECPLCDRMEWPEDLVSHRRTKVMDEQSVPAGLLKAHSTKNGVWAKIHVLEGELEYCVDEPVNQNFPLLPERSGIVVPGIFHRLEIREKASFYLKFWRLNQPEAGQE